MGPVVSSPEMRTTLPQRPTWHPFLGQVVLAGSIRLGDPDELTDENFDMAMNAPAAAIDFWSETCAPCMQYKPIFEDVATQAPEGVLMATMNAEYAKQTMERYGVDALPTTLYLVNGREVNRTQGKQTKEQLLALISQITPGKAARPQDQVMPQVTTPGQTVAAPVPTTPSTTVSPAPSQARPAAQAQIAPPLSRGPSTMTLVAGGLAIFAVIGTLAYTLSR